MEDGAVGFGEVGEFVFDFGDLVGEFEVAA